MGLDLNVDAIVLFKKFILLLNLALELLRVTLTNALTVLITIDSWVLLRQKFLIVASLALSEKA